MSNPSDQDKGRRRDAFGVNPHRIYIPGFDGSEGPEHPLYDRRVERLKRGGREAVASLIDSMVRDGQIHDVSCKKNGDVIECGIGRHRVVAARFIVDEINPKFEIRATYPRLTDAQWRDRIIAENLERIDSDAFTEALAFADYLRFSDMAALSKLTRLAPKTLDRILALVEMPEDVKALVIDRGVKRDVAIEVAKVHTSQQAEVLRAWLAGDLQTPATARALAEGATRARDGAKPPRTPPKPAAGVLPSATRPQISRAYKALTAGKIAAEVPEPARQLLRALHGEVVPSSAPAWLQEFLRAAGIA